MAALSTEHRKMMKFGTLVEMVMKSNLTNFGVSRTNSIAPSRVQKFTFLKINPCTKMLFSSSPDFSLHANHLAIVIIFVLTSKEYETNDYKPNPTACNPYLMHCFRSGEW